MNTQIIYSGIGSRKTSENVQNKMQAIALALAQRGFKLRSGGAQGADSAFEQGAYLGNGDRDIFIPWPGFNQHPSQLNRPTPAAYTLAKEHHPNWDALNGGVKSLHARNCHVILGHDLNTPSAFVVCWTVGGAVTGGTGQALRIAIDRKIPIFNLWHPNCINKLDDFIDELLDKQHA